MFMVTVGKYTSPMDGAGYTNTIPTRSHREFEDDFM